jgi:hypothetical protein
MFGIIMPGIMLGMGIEGIIVGIICGIELIFRFLCGLGAPLFC